MEQTLNGHEVAAARSGAARSSPSAPPPPTCHTDSSTAALSAPGRRAEDPRRRRQTRARRARPRREDLARALRDAGMEVIYTGLHQTPEQIAETVHQEDADVVGIAILSGAHMILVPQILELSRAGRRDVVLRRRDDPRRGHPG